MSDEQRWRSPKSEPFAKLGSTRERPKIAHAAQRMIPADHL
jgi:hypothetical protein